MTQHIIDTDELEKLPRYEQDKFLVRYEDVVKLIANSPQADGMVLVPIEPTEEMETVGDMNLLLGAKQIYKAMLSAYKPQADEAYGQDFNLEYTCKRIRRLLNALGMSDPSDGKDYVLMGMLFTLLGTICSKLEKPQADDVPPDVYDIVVDTGDGIYHTAEVVHFQQSGSKRMIQVRFGDTQADDVRKDAWISVEDRLPPLNGDEVLAYRKDDDWIVICLFMDIGFAYFSEQEEQYVTAHAITHWQPLPAPIKQWSR